MHRVRQFAPALRRALCRLPPFCGPYHIQDPGGGPKDEEYDHQDRGSPKQPIERPADEAPYGDPCDHLGRKLERLPHGGSTILLLGRRRFMTRACVTHLAFQIVQTALNGLSLAVALAATGFLNGSRHIVARSLGNGLKGLLGPSLGRTLEFGIWACQGCENGRGKA